jgi:uncharacterized protein YndB with AHSA1/START domain
MMSLPPEPISVETVIHAPAAHTWKTFTDPEAVKKWNAASEDWHTPRAENDLRPGGRFSYRMEARDGSAGFDFTGTYDAVVEPHRIEYTMDDGRKVIVLFVEEDGTTRVTETFMPELEHAPAVQKAGWQSILDNLKTYAESSS